MRPLCPAVSDHVMDKDEKEGGRFLIRWCTCVGVGMFSSV